jgi:hypothetical protein
MERAILGREDEAPRKDLLSGWPAHQWKQARNRALPMGILLVNNRDGSGLPAVVRPVTHDWPRGRSGHLAR